MSELKSHIAAQIDAAEPGQVWVPTDFAQMASRDAIVKTLQRMVRAGELRRINSGLNDRPRYGCRCQIDPYARISPTQPYPSQRVAASDVE